MKALYFRIFPENGDPDIMSTVVKPIRNVYIFSFVREI